MCTPSSQAASGKPFSFACSGVSGVTLMASSKSFASGGSIVIINSPVRSSLSAGTSLSLNVRDTSLAWSVTWVGNLSSRSYARMTACVSTDGVPCSPSTSRMTP